MPNSANTDKYRIYKEEVMKLFCEENFNNSKFIDLVGSVKKYKIEVYNYRGEVGNRNYIGSKCLFYEGDVFRKQWYCLDNSAAFYNIITHKNGKDYLIFRQDLYGYSVLNIESGEILQFFPESSLKGIETFIWTGVSYDSESNVLAVSGCYWAHPDSVQLFLFEDIMCDKPRFIDIISCLDGAYDVYDELTFLKWENGDLYLKAFLVEGLKTMELVIHKEQYISWLNDDKISKYL